MKLEIFTVYDSKAEAYSRPMFFESKGVAIRSFMDTLKNQEHPFAQHPEDFTLFHIGSWEDHNAQFIQNKTPISAGVALEFMPKVNPKPLSPVKTEEHVSEVKGA